MTQNLVFVLGGLLAFLFLIASMVSLTEKNRGAASRFFMLFLVVFIIYAIPLIIHASIIITVLSVFTGLWITALLITAFPYNKYKIESWQNPVFRIDERTIMFSRNLLKPGTKRFSEYYKEFPQHAEPDNDFRKNPGLLSGKSKYFSPDTFHAAASAFKVIEDLRDFAEGVPANKKVDVIPEETSNFLEKWSKKQGAHSYGITKLEDYHKYSVVGRGKSYGEQVKLDHENAIAITTEMNHEMVAYAPQGPIVMESARQYVNSGVIALKLAAFIRSLGYEARAHIDGNYRVVCPLVARDAGLGEIGRMGLLMTPRLGPRVRIAAVTTDMPLLTNEKVSQPSVIDFCLKCKKCAEVCPSKAISFGEPDEIDGVRRWQINQEACFTVWTKFGTDCGRCMAVCPYSHPDNLLHSMVRSGLKQSSLFRSAALKMDDLFYRRRPAPRKLAEWFLTKE